MNIIPMNTLALGAIMLDLAVKADPKAPNAALVVAETLDESVLEALGEGYQNVYWASCSTPVACVLIELSRMKGLGNVDIHVILASDAHVEHIFMQGTFTAHMTETQLQYALAA